MLKILGHRGNPAEYADNTLAGIKSAASLCDGVEVDFRRCLTGELVLAHDPVVAGNVIAETPFDVLVGELGLAAADDLFAADLDTDLDLEIKNWPLDPGFEADHTIGFDVAGRARERDIATCFYWPTVDAVRAILPNVSTGLLFEGAVQWAAALNHALRQGHSVLAPHHSLIGIDLVRAAHENAVGVAAWTVDDRRRVFELAEMGVDTIITNTPADVAGWIQEDSE
jgi:glycerophosphoryl diester phosphodiesterase